MPVMNPTAIILNGASSAGKSSIARELVPLLGKDTISTGFDDVLLRSRAAKKGLLQRFLRQRDPNERINVFRQLHAEVLHHLEQGKHVVVDTSIMESAAVEDLAKKLASHRAYFIGVKPPLSVSERWEKESGDRPIGQARKHYDLVHRYGEYDLVLDTSKMTPAEAAQLIVAHADEQLPAALAHLQVH